MPSIKSQYAMQFSMEKFPQDLYLWTFTWAQALDIVEARAIWHKFLNKGGPRARTLVNAFPTISGIRVFEMHPGKKVLGEQLSHGLHVHAVVNDRIPVDIVRSLWEFHGGGRVHVKWVPRDKAMYVGKYLCKARIECLKGVRLWAPFGRCEASKVKDIVVDTRWTSAYQFCATIVDGFKEMRWDQRARFVTQFVFGDNIQEAFASIGMHPLEQTEDEHYTDPDGVKSKSMEWTPFEP